MATWILPTQGGILGPDLVKFHEPTSSPKSKGKLYVKKVAAVSLFQEILIVFYLLSRHVKVHNKKKRPMSRNASHNAEVCRHTLLLLSPVLRVNREPYTTEIAFLGLCNRSSHSPANTIQCQAGVSPVGSEPAV